MPQKIANYAASIGLPTTFGGQVQALQVLGVPVEQRIPSLENSDRLPEYCRGPVDAVPTVPDMFSADFFPSPSSQSGNTIVVYFNGLPDDNGSEITLVEYDIDGGEPVALRALPPTDGSPTFIPVAGPGTYALRFRATNAAGVGEWTTPAVNVLVEAA